MSSPNSDLNVQFANQQDPNSCWACCTRLVLNYYQKVDVYKTDTELANALKLKVNDLQDIRKVLEQTNMFNGLDDTDNIPPIADIKKQLNTGRPLIICISGKAIKPGGDCIGGHYVILMGLDESANKITIIDPADEKGNKSKQVIPYDPKIYKASYNPKLYWGVPYYTKPPV